MKTLWILAAAATFAACHNRSNDETGAAPDRGDTTRVSGYDTTSVKHQGTGYDTTTMSPSRSGTTTDTSMRSMPQTGKYDSTSVSSPSPSTGVGTDTTTSPGTGATGTSAPDSSTNHQ